MVKGPLKENCGTNTKVPNPYVPYKTSVTIFQWKKRERERDFSNQELRTRVS
jgi:hypothetical protein